MKKNQNRIYINNCKIYFGNRYYDYINLKVYITQMKASWILTLTIIRIEGMTHQQIREVISGCARRMKAQLRKSNKKKALWKFALRALFHLLMNGLV